MEWIDTVWKLAGNPLVQRAVEEGARGIVRRVRRRRRAAEAHSEAGPALTASTTEGTETPVLTTRGKTGEQLAEELLQHWMFGNTRTNAATRLLGALPRRPLAPAHLR
ncbi:hypothetical protein [Streptomyces sp. NPDC056544]|uniref:hypothetical protein n=1 Tax=unclassified Streptomyces TaxID=2593676 RepID=UPI003676672B